MESGALLARKVERLRRRVRLLVALRWATAGLAAAAFGCCLLAAADHAGWWPGAMHWIGPALALGALAGLVAGAARPIASLAAARLADQRLGLQERLSSALQLAEANRLPALSQDPAIGRNSPVPDPAGCLAAGAGGGAERAALAAPPTPMVAAQLADAAAHAADLSPARVFPWRPGREIGWLGATGALLLASLSLPALPLFHGAGERAERAAMAASAREYDRAAAAIEGRSTGDAAQDRALADLARRLRRLASDQRRGRLSRRESLLRASQLQEVVDAAERRMRAPAARRPLEPAAAALREAAARRRGRLDAAGARALASLGHALAGDDLEGAARQLEQLGRQLDRAAAAGRAAPTSLRQAAAVLAEMARALEGSPAAAAGRDLQRAADRLGQAAAAAPPRPPAVLAPAERAALQEPPRPLAAAALKEAGAAAGVRAAGAFRAAARSDGAAAALRQASAALAGSRRAPAAAAEAGADGPPSGDGTGRGAGRGAGTGPGPRRSMRATGREVRIPGRENAWGAPVTQLYPDRADPKSDDAPAYAASPAFRRRAETALRREEIPPAYRRRVRDYFAAIAQP